MMRLNVGRKIFSNFLKSTNVRKYTEHHSALNVLKFFTISNFFLIIFAQK